MSVIHVPENPELRILKSRKSFENVNNNNSRESQVNSIKKCLFGVPDAEDVDTLLHEQIKVDWERIKNRFGINIEDIENMERQTLETHTPKKRKLDSTKGKRMNSSRRRRLFQQPYNNDRKITDFYQARKTGHLEKKEQ